MVDRPYHHGNLEEILIERGLILLNEEGIENFSLRRVASVCGVSHAAPYKHFADKDALLSAIWRHVMCKFSEALEETFRETSDTLQRMRLLGVRYLQFFMENPHYFHYLITRSTVQINLSKLDVTSEFRPFEIFKRAARESLAHLGIPSERSDHVLIGMWAVIHGITSLAVMQNIQYDGDWNELLFAMYPNFGDDFCYRVEKYYTL